MFDPRFGGVCGCMGFHYFGGSRPSADFKQKNQPIKVGFFLIIFRLRFLHPALRLSLRAFVTRKVHFASLRDRFSSYSHASAAEEQHQTLNKKKPHQKGGVSFLFKA
jgi:hypothetical protein